MSPVGKLLSRGVGLFVSGLVMVASGFMVGLMGGGGMYAGSKHEVNVAGTIFCVSALASLACFIGVVMSIIALGRAQDEKPVSASRTSAPPR